MIETTDDSLLGGRVGLTQPARGHRAGTDAVLLAASAPVRAGEMVVDVGAASGAVGLMVAARSCAAATAGATGSRRRLPPSTSWTGLRGWEQAWSVRAPTGS
jgi:hypothetical protein